MASLKKLYYGLIRGNRSGVYIDGCVERTGFMSIPLRQEISKVLIRIKPLCSTKLQYFINNGYFGSILLESDIATIDVGISDEMKKTDFLYIKFVSEKDTDIGPLPLTFTQRKVSFLIQDISLQKEDNSKVEDIGLPEFQK
jgi:hypothetical protein